MNRELSPSHGSGSDDPRGRGVAQRVVCGAFVAAALCAGPAPAQAPPPQPPQRTEGSSALARPRAEAPVFRHGTDGTAFFIDDLGHMLTARHAVADCARVLVFKEGRVVAARVIALSARYDLGLIKVPRTLGLSATFPRGDAAAANEMVFAAAYDTLAPTLRQGGALANATVMPALGGGEPGHIVLHTAITFGGSGAPVLDSRGLVEGVVSRRTGPDRVLAVGAPEAKAFLTAEHVRFFQDDRPQMSATGSRAHRAASISARVTCLQ